MPLSHGLHSRGQRFLQDSASRLSPERSTQPTPSRAGIPLIRSAGFPPSDCRAVVVKTSRPPNSRPRRTVPREFRHGPSPTHGDSPTPTHFLDPHPTLVTAVPKSIPP